jgi:hypothetical protein
VLFMGIIKNTNTNRFTRECVLNKDLVMKMLKHEEEITKGTFGQDMYRNSFNDPFISLSVEKALNRQTLSDFGFDTSDESVQMYRTIFKTYFKSPDDYDREVINSVHYMRENKCVFYKHPSMKLGQRIPNVDLYRLDGETKTTLYDAIGHPRPEHTIFAAFSLS